MLRKSGWKTILKECKSFNMSREIVISNNVNPLAWFADPLTFDCLNPIAEGTVDGQRIGRKIHITKITVHGVISRPGALFVVPNPRNVNLVKLWLLVDTQNNEGDVPLTVPCPLVNIGSNTLMNTAALREQDYHQRYVMLADLAIRMAPQSLAWNVDQQGYFQVGDQRYFEICKELDMYTTYTGSGGDLYNILDNAIHILACTNEEPELTTLAYQAQLEYYDDE